MLSPFENEQECTHNTDNAIMEKESDGANSVSVSEDVKLVLEVGMVVNVEARHWPGINKPGGVARITRVIRDNTRPTITQYNVAYILGGTEKRVDGTFVSVLNEMNANTTLEEQEATMLAQQEMEQNMSQPSPIEMQMDAEMEQEMGNE